MEEFQEEKKQKSGWLIVLYLLPIYILVAYPLVKWIQKVNSPDIILPKDEFSVPEQIVPVERPKNVDKYRPRLPETALTVRYSSKKVQEDSAEKSKKTISQTKETPQGEPIPQTRDEKQAVQSKQPISEEKEKELKNVGFIRGYLTQRVEKLMDNPKALQLMFNNPLVVRGFMERVTVRSILSDSKALENFLTRTNAINNFLGNSTVQKALTNPEVINTIAQSKLMNEILSSPAVSQLLKNPEIAGSIIQSNSQLSALLTNPNIMNALINNPQTAGAWTQFNIQNKFLTNP